MTRVKICGITNLKDALLAAKLGADELGFNFYRGSSRFVETETCVGITAGLPEHIVKVGVFVNENVDDVCRISELTRVDTIQLHGDESPGFIHELRRRSNCRLIRAVRVTSGFEPADVLHYDTDSILLDAASAGQYGGTGNSFDWNRANDVRATVADLYLAGGLTAENVAAAIRTVRPHAVDTASGVEISPGTKDPEKLRSFITAARNA